MNGKINKIKRVATLLGLCVMFMLPVRAYADADTEEVIQAKTTPPTVVSPFTIFDPDYEYLEKGQGYLTDQGNRKVNLWGESYGTERMDNIGVQLTLQRWTGTVWVDVYYGASVIESDAAYVGLAERNFN